MSPPPRYMGRRPKVAADPRQTRMPLVAAMLRACRICGCTDADCRQCIARTGSPCSWVSADLCSACAPGNIPPGLAA